ncbi:reverse transcriptase domain-containing protein [Tanacetum coccineum]
MKKSNFLWTEEAKSAFRQMKELIAKLPMLTAPEEKEELVIYLAASKEAVSVVLMTEREAKQMPIYFVSRALRGPEVNYTSMEKLILSWNDQKKKTRTIPQRKENRSRPNRPCSQTGHPVLTNAEREWYSRIRRGTEFTYALQFQFEATNNEAEYEALIAGLRIAEKIGVQNLQVNVDSKLVENQVNGTYVAKETDMIKYLEKVKTLASAFWEFSIKQVPRNGNKKVDALSKMASTSFAHLSKQVLVEELKEKSVNEIEVLAVVEEEGDSWMTPIHEYLTDETLPAERKKARAIKRKSQRFAIINEILYKKSFLGPWLRCVGPSQANYVLREIHEGSCSMHAGTRSVVAKALRIGYYWPTMHKDARALIKACQEFGLPVVIISDNGNNPETTPLKTGVKNWEGIKARLGKYNKNWMEEVSHVLWAHRTMIKTSNGDTPFSLTYGTEAKCNLELLEEKREQAAIREAKSKRQMEKYYNTKVQNTSFKPGDLVYRSNEASYVEDTEKLGPKWEGPYEVTEALGKGSYKLRDRNRKELPRT